MKKQIREVFLNDDYVKMDTLIRNGFDVLENNGFYLFYAIRYNSRHVLHRLCVELPAKCSVYAESLREANFLGKIILMNDLIVYMLVAGVEPVVCERALHEVCGNTEFVKTIEQHCTFVTALTTDDNSEIIDLIDNGFDVNAGNGIYFVLAVRAHAEKMLYRMQCEEDAVFWNNNFKVFKECGTDESMLTDLFVYMYEKDVPYEEASRCAAKLTSAMQAMAHRTIDDLYEIRKSSRKRKRINRFTIHHDFHVSGKRDRDY